MSKADRRRSRRKGTPIPFLVAGAVIALVIGWSLYSRAQPAPSSAPSEAAQVAALTTSVAAATFDQVGAGGLADPLKATAFTTLRGDAGKPLVVYVGADYCPYCASERWSVVAALSRFGTFRDLALTTSSSSDVYPDTPSFTFRGASYSSEIVEFSFVETADREGKPLATPTPVQRSALDRSDPRAAIPFLSVADRFVAVGSGYRPDVLAGRSHLEIARSLSDPTSAIARGIIGNANHITAAICEVTGDQPASVCSSAAVRGLAR